MECKANANKSFSKARKPLVLHDIAKAVEYATSNGATIQNMSFGSYAESSTLKAALDLAYASSLLVAAAGNDGICIGPPTPPCSPFFPAAYTYVIGVQDY